MAMTLGQIVAEMARKPDADYLAGWIADHAESLEDARTAINAYFEALEDE